MKCNLATFVATFGLGGDGKEKFCYQRLRSIEDLRVPLEEICLRDFDDHLKGYNQLREPYLQFARVMRKEKISETAALKKLGMKERPLRGTEVFRRLKQEWRDRGYTTLKDVLRNYAIHDVLPFFRACCAFRDAFASLGLGTMFNSFVSLAQMSFYYILGANESSEDFYLIPKDIYESMRERLVGGPSICYRRHAKKNESRIREPEFGEEAELVEEILTYDITSHYANIMMTGEFPVGVFQIRRKSESFRGCVLTPKTNESIMWMGYLQLTEIGQPIKTMYNCGEVQIWLSSPRPRMVRVDGAYKENGKIGVLEYLECSGSHGKCPECVEKLKQSNKKESKKSKTQREQTMERLRAIENEPSVGSVRWIWECRWKEMKQSDPKVRDFVSRFAHGEGKAEYRSENDLIEDVMIEERMSGLLLATIKLADHRMAEFDSFPLFFEKRWVEPTGPLKEILVEEGNKGKRERKVIPTHSMRGWIHTTALRWYYHLLGDDLQVFDVEVRHPTMATKQSVLTTFRYSSRAKCHAASKE